MGEPAPKVDPEEETKKAVLEVTKQWNGFINSLIKATVAWDSYVKVREENPNLNLEEFPVKAQKILLLANYKGDLDVIIEDMILHGRHFAEHLKAQLIGGK